MGRPGGVSDLIPVRYRLNLLRISSQSDNPRAEARQVAVQLLRSVLSRVDGDQDCTNDRWLGSQLSDCRSHLLESLGALRIASVAEHYYDAICQGRF